MVLGTVDTLHTHSHCYRHLLQRVIFRWSSESEIGRLGVDASLLLVMVSLDRSDETPLIVVLVIIFLFSLAGPFFPMNSSHVVLISKLLPKHFLIILTLYPVHMTVLYDHFGIKRKPFYCLFMKVLAISTLVNFTARTAGGCHWK